MIGDIATAETDAPQKGNSFRGLEPMTMGRTAASSVTPTYTPKSKPAKSPVGNKKADPVQDAYDVYARSRQPGHLDNVLDAAEPTIAKAITSYGGGNGTLIKSRARLIAADAVNSYTPGSGTQLNSWLMTNLQSLQRYRQQLNPIAAPERAAIELGLLDRNRRELEQQTGFPPTDQELSEHTGISPKRMRYLHKFTTNVMPESGLKDDEGAQWLPGVPDEHPDAMWAELVYHDLDPANKTIYDMMLGRGEHNGQRYSTTDIAKKLKISSSAVSQRSAKIASMLEQGEQYKE